MTTATIQRVEAAGPDLVRDKSAGEPRDDSGEGPRAAPQSLLSGFKHVLAAQGEREQTQKSALVAFALRCLSAGLLYLTQIVLARWMGNTEYGIYVAVWTWVLILGGMSHLGLNLAAIRLAPVYRETGDANLLRGLIRGSRVFALCSGTAVMLAGLAGVWLLSDRIESAFVWPLYLALICVPLHALTDVQDGLGRGHGWMATALAPPYVLRPALLLLGMLIAHILGQPMTAATAASAAIAATWLSGIVQSAFLNSKLTRIVPEGPRSYAFGSWLKISFPLLAILACDLTLQNADVLVISKYLQPQDVGVYFAATKTMALIMFVHYAVGSATANKFAALHARGDREGLRAFVKDAVNWTFWPSLASAIVILLLGKPLLWLFGPAFEAGYPVMCILVFGFLLRSAMGPAEFLLNMLGEQALCAAVLVSAAITDIALNFALVPQFGIIGAAIATSFSLGLAAVLNSIVVWRRLGIEIAIWKNLPRPPDQPA